MPILPSFHVDAKSERVRSFYFNILVEAPVFCRTAEEWANPVLYIEKIRKSVVYGGICKIKLPIKLVSPCNNNFCGNGLRFFNFRHFWFPVIFLRDNLHLARPAYFVGVKKIGRPRRSRCRL